MRSGSRNVRDVRDDDDQVDEEIIEAAEEKYQEADERRSKRASKEFGVLQISDFEEKTRKILAQIELKDGRTVPLRVTYDPSLVNDAMQGQIVELSDDGDTLAAATVFCEVVKEWGVVGELKSKQLATDENDKIMRDENFNPIWIEEIIVAKGEPVPLDPHYVKWVRTDVVIGIWQELHKDANGGKSRESRRKSRRR